MEASAPPPKTPLGAKNLSVQAQKATSKCTRCGRVGHWYQDGECRPEDIRLFKEAKVEAATVAGFKIVSKPGQGI